jgi:hypothetical protein
MAEFTPKQLRNIGEPGLTGDVPSKNDPESVDRKASNAFLDAQREAQQARINAGRNPGIGAKP